MAKLYFGKLWAAGLASVFLLTACAANPTSSGQNSIEPATEPAVAGEPGDAATDAATDAAEPAASSNVTLVTTNSFAISDEAIAAFEAETGLTLTVVPIGSAGVLANQLVLTRDHPLGDAFFGVDNTFASRITAADVVAPFTPSTLPAELTALGGDSLTPVTRGDVCLNIDLDWFAAHPEVSAPNSFADLLVPELQGQTVLLNPTSSSPGMAFMLATIAEFGDYELGTAAGLGAVEPGAPGSWQDYWQRLLANDALVVDSWSQGYFTDFSGASEGGTRPIVVSYASSPASTLNDAGDATTTAALLDTCFTQVEFAGVLNGAANPAGAERLIEFLTSEQFQSELPTQMWVYPIVDTVPLPDDWAQFTTQAPNPLYLAPEDIEANRERWLEQWLQLALQ